MVSRPVGADWEPRQSLPSGRELASYMASAFGYGSADGQAPHDLARVSQYVALTAGKDALYHGLRAGFAHHHKPTPLHLFLAELPALMDKKGYGAREQIVLTTNYDDVLEHAFRAKGVP